jgi:hypothetical protein
MTNIYFIKDDNLNIKIGMSIDIDKRRRELQTGNADKLFLLYYIENVSETFEKHIHDICEAYHINGEWFEMGAINHLLSHPWFLNNMKKPEN